MSFRSIDIRNNTRVVRRFGPSFLFALVVAFLVIAILGLSRRKRYSQPRENAVDSCSRQSYLHAAKAHRSEGGSFVFPIPL